MGAVTAVSRWVWLFCDPVDGSPLGSSVHGILQARILEDVAISSSRGSSQPRDWIRVFCIPGWFFTAEPPGSPSVWVHSGSFIQIFTTGLLSKLWDIVKDRVLQSMRSQTVGQDLATGEQQKLVLATYSVFIFYYYLHWCDRHLSCSLFANILSLEDSFLWVELLLQMMCFFKRVVST